MQRLLRIFLHEVLPQWPVVLPVQLYRAFTDYSTNYQGQHVTHVPLNQRVLLYLALALGYTVSNPYHVLKTSPEHNWSTRWFSLVASEGSPTGIERLQYLVLASLYYRLNGFGWKAARFAYAVMKEVTG